MFDPKLMGAELLVLGHDPGELSPRESKSGARASPLKAAVHLELQQEPHRGSQVTLRARRWCTGTGRPDPAVHQKRLGQLNGNLL